MSLLEKYNDFSNKQSRAVALITAVIRDSLPFLILLLNIVVAVLTELYDPELQNPFTLKFFIELFMNTLTTMVCYSCFVKYGEKNEKLGSEAYSKNLAKWGAMSGEVRSHYSDDFIVYCRKQVEKEREDTRHFYILNHTMLTIEEYESKYRSLHEEDIDKLVARGALHRKEAMYIKLANKTGNLKPINPLIILCGVNKMSINDVGRDGMNAATMAILTRPLYMFALTAILSMLNGTPRGIDGASAIFDIVYSVMMIVVASITGFSAGAEAGRKEHDKIKGRIFFLERYLASVGVSTEKQTGNL
jgi:hypothetical protein